MRSWDKVVVVVDRARSAHPYVVADKSRVYRQVSATEMEGVPIWEHYTVMSLLDSGQFTWGARGRLSCGQYTRNVDWVVAPTTDTSIRAADQSKKSGGADGR